MENLLNEFYKKGCQEKKLRLDRRREDLFLEIQPTVCKSASRFEREVLVVACLPSLWGSSADGDDADRVWTYTTTRMRMRPRPMARIGRCADRACRNTVFLRAVSEDSQGNPAFERGSL